MRRELIAGLAVSAIFTLSSASQTLDQQSKSVPIYRVTVIERSLKAINYRYRSLPTNVDFRGTVLMPMAKGEALVESKRGRTEIDAKLANLEPSQRFGREYLTYVLWAITPEGRPHNIGELVPDASNKAKIRVTTDLQAFGLMVTAEPYSAVRRPSDVVVAENQLRSDTVGKIEQVEAKYELMPRGEYTWQTANGMVAPVGPKVSMNRYEATLHVYQAQNAIGIAKTAGAERYAPNTLLKAERLLGEAQRLENSRADTRSVVESAREAAQTAEDARAIAERREHDDRLTSAQSEVISAQRAKLESEAEALRARAAADVARQQTEAERAARERAELDAAAARSRAAQAEARMAADRSRIDANMLRQEEDRREATKRADLRMRLLEQLNGVASTLDTPRGLVATIHDNGFNGTMLRGETSAQLTRIAAIVRAHPSLKIAVEGHTDSAGTEGLSRMRAYAVRDALTEGGLAGVAEARDLGNTHPTTSNATATGRRENRRVEIVISGDPIGKQPFWDRTYSLTK